MMAKRVKKAINRSHGGTRLYIPTLLDSPVYSCYCYQYLARTEKMNLYLDKLSDFISGTDREDTSTCAEYVNQKLEQQTLTVISGLVVAGLNALMKLAMKKVVHFERRISASQIEMSKMWKLFVAQFVNTGMLLFIVNLNLYDVGSVFRFESTIQQMGLKDMPMVGAFFKDGLPIFRGRFDDLVSQWYDIVGVALFIQAFIFVFASSLTPVAIRVLKAKLLARRPPEFHTQYMYDSAYRLREFDIALRFAQHTNIFFCVLIYSSGLPLLNWLGAFHFGLSFYLDKVSFLWYSRRPPQYSAALPKLAALLMTIAVLLHSLFAMTMLGLQSVFPSPYVFSWIQPVIDRWGLNEQNDPTRRQIEMGMGIDETTQSFSSYIIFRFFDFFRLATVWFWFPVVSVALFLNARLFGTIFRRAHLKSESSKLS